MGCHIYISVTKYSNDSVLHAAGRGGMRIWCLNWIRSFRQEFSIILVEVCPSDSVILLLKIYLCVYMLYAYVRNIIPKPK